MAKLKSKFLPELTKIAPSEVFEENIEDYPIDIMSTKEAMESWFWEDGTPIENDDNHIEVDFCGLLDHDGKLNFKLFVSIFDECGELLPNAKEIIAQHNTAH